MRVVEVLIQRADGPADHAVHVACSLSGRGTRAHVPGRAVAADLAVPASDREGVPMAVLETLAAGVPVLASAVGGLREVPDGVLEPARPGSVDDLAHGLDNPLQDCQLRVARGASGTQWTTDRLSGSTLHGGCRSIYTDVTGRGRPRRG